MLQKTSHFLREANYIDGAWVSADNDAVIDVTNPANGQRIGGVPKCGRAETKRAIEAAQKAFESFRKTTANERAQMLRRLHDLILENQDALAELLVLEQGKPLAEAKGEVGMSAAYVLWFAEEGRRIYGDTVPSPWADRRIMVIKEPVGVIVAEDRVHRAGEPAKLERHERCDQVAAMQDDLDRAPRQLAERVTQVGDVIVTVADDAEKHGLS